MLQTPLKRFESRAFATEPTSQSSTPPTKHNKFSPCLYGLPSLHLAPVQSATMRDNYLLSMTTSASDRPSSTAKTILTSSSLPSAGGLRVTLSVGLLSDFGIVGVGLAVLIAVCCFFCCEGYGKTVAAVRTCFGLAEESEADDGAEDHAQSVPLRIEGLSGVPVEPSARFRDYAPFMKNAMQ